MSRHVHAFFVGGNMEIKTKKKTGIIIAIACAAVVIGGIIYYAVGFFNRATMTKEDIFEYVSVNQEELLTYILDTTFNDNQKLKYDGFTVSSYEDGAMVDFEVFAFGLAPSSSYRGFYYVTEDEPIGFQGLKVEFVQQGSQLYWTDGTDNEMHVEKILPHWYWYEMKF